MQGIRGKYVERTRDVRRTYAAHGFDSHDFFDGLFLAVFSEVLTVSSRISSFPQILGLSESRRQSPWLAQPGWKPSHLGCPRVPACRQACSPWMVSLPSCFWLVLSESASSGTALFRRPSWAALLSGLRGLRFVLPFFRGPGAVALGHTGSLLGYSEQGVFFPGGSKVMVKELLKACPFSVAQSTQLNPRSLKEAGQSPRTKHLPN